jgi:membrane associated rhomboid family serine protease
MTVRETTRQRPALPRRSLRMAGSHLVSGLPAVTTTVTVALLVAAIVTLGPHPLVAPGVLVLEGTAVPEVGTFTWWLAHGSLAHLAANLTVLWWVAPPLERLVGPLRMVVAVAAGVIGGALGHLLVHGGAVPILGASSVVAALGAYNLVVGWHCPLEDRRGRAVLWPSHLFHAVVAIEIVRILAELATGGVPTGAAAHLGGLAAGVLVCGCLHGRWPSRPASRTPLRSRPVTGILTGT